MTSLNRTASWIIRNRETREVVCEMWDAKVVRRINAEKYEAVPILDYLQELNRKLRAQQP